MPDKNSINLFMQQEEYYFPTSWLGIIINYLCSNSIGLSYTYNQTRNRHIGRYMLDYNEQMSHIILNTACGYAATASTHAKYHYITEVMHYWAGSVLVLSFIFFLVANFKNQFC